MRDLGHHKVRLSILKRVYKECITFFKYIVRSPFRTPGATETGKQVDALADRRNLDYCTLSTLRPRVACYHVEVVVWL